MSSDSSDSSVETPNKPSEPTKLQLAFGFVCLLGVICGVFLLGSFIYEKWIDPPPPTQEDLQSAVEKELRPNRDVRVTVTKHRDGSYFVFAEYRPLLKEVGPIEDEMMDTYKTIYKFELPVAGAEVVAYANLVDRYGNQSENAIYRSALDRETAMMVNWEELHLVTPDRVFNDSWRHPAIR